MVPTKETDASDHLMAGNWNIIANTYTTNNKQKAKDKIMSLNVVAT